MLRHLHCKAAHIYIVSTARIHQGDTVFVKAWKEDDPQGDHTCQWCFLKSFPAVLQLLLNIVMGVETAMMLQRIYSHFKPLEIRRWEVFCLRIQFLLELQLLSA